MIARNGSRWLVAALVAAAAPAGVARAEGDVAARLAAYEAEAQKLGADLPRANQAPGPAARRRLLDAEVAYALGDYDAAALALFDLAGRPGPDRAAAGFYLAESLFHKGDHGAAAGYYQQVVAGGGVASRYYQPALARLIEIAIAQNDDSRLGEVLAALDRVSPGLRAPQVPYVRGKLAYAQGKYDEALALFQSVPKGSDREMQAAYYAATTYVAKHDLARATEIFTDLIGKKPQTSADRRMVELSQLALGRLYYERDQPSKSIDSYLLVDRHSDLFPDALYEVAWVYVKSKQYDKALRALELLARSDPQSDKTPTVRILEGNLRIRKAQLLRGAQILGTTSAEEQDDPEAEYDRAVQVFTETHDLYLPSYAALVQMASGGAPAEQYLSQIAGRFEHVFQAAAPIPEAAVQYLRDQPEVKRAVRVEAGLGEIAADLAQAEATIARLEGVLAARDRTAVFPELALRRARIAELEAGLIELRSELAEQELRLVASPGELSRRSADRRQRTAALSALPDPGRTAAEHAAQDQERCDAVERSAVEVEAAIGQAQAMAVALRKYGADTPDLPAEQRTAAAAALDAAAREAAAIEDELHAVHAELQLGRDLAGAGDGSAAAAEAARRQARSAEDAEHVVLARLAGTSRDRGRSQRLSALGDRAARLAAQLARTARQIDEAVDQGLGEVRAALAEDRAALAAYQAELAAAEAESRSIGGRALAASVQEVKAKFYDIVIRTDLGNVDVAWAQKEDVDDDLKRLNLSRQRELRQLRDEFKDILDAGAPAPALPAKVDLPAPVPRPGPPGGSLDKGTGEQRISPSGARGGASSSDRSGASSVAPGGASSSDRSGASSVAPGGASSSDRPPARPGVQPGDTPAPPAARQSAGKTPAANKPGAKGGAR